jgi:predicted nucleic acid-binding protein
VEQYGDIVRANGFSRTRVFDRLIAATALVHDLTLVTINGADFRDNPGLNLEVWPVPAQ